MDRDDSKRYFIVGSVIMEVVAPLFRTRLENDYKSRLGSLPAFLNSQPVIHILFHLRHRNTWCHINQQNCVNNQALPLNYSQWDLLYAENPGQRNHNCHCKYTAKPVQLEDLDTTLASLILLNCCNLTPADEQAIRTLRQYKNDYLSHNTKGRITQTEYNTLWPDITKHVLQLDNSKGDELVRIKNRPMDESLCNKYMTCLLDIYQKLEEMGVSIQELYDLIQRKSDVTHGLLQAMIGAIQGNTDLLQELVNNVRSGVCPLCRQPQQVNLSNKQKPYTLGQSIFHLHHQFDVRSVLSSKWRVWVTDGVMMDDGRLVLCLPYMCRLLICNTDGFQTDSIPLQYSPVCVTAVNNSTVAVTSVGSDYIEMYDINNKHKLKSIQGPGRCGGITTINNKLVVGVIDKLYIIDHQTGEVVQTIIKKNYSLFLWVPCVHATGDRIFYSDGLNNNLYCYSNTDDRHSTTTLPSTPRSITSVQDGSLYVVCVDGSVQHVSSDGKHYKPVTTEGLKSVGDCMVISYNQKQRKLVTCTLDETVQVFKEA